MEHGRNYPGTTNDAACALFGNALLQQVPGAYIWLGQGTGPAGPPLHDPAYDFSDDVMPVGAALLAALAERRLGI